ncbi:MAG: sigma 54-interacting transcriptional regulator [Sandaracinus sp.]
MASPRARAASTELAFGRYEHRAELGLGGSGRVVEVVDHADGGALRALKIVLPEHAERLAWELEVLAGASHPSLARVHELLRVETALGPPFRLARGAFVLVEDRAPGVPSGPIFAGLEPGERGPLVRALAAQIAGALDALHARGLAHGDVKPSNVVASLEDEPRATLVDLGLAVPFGRRATGGTPRFLAPEALLGERSPATDLYALGATMHEWLVPEASEPSRSDATPTLARRRAELPLWVDADLAELVRACLAERVADRPRAVADVLRALGATDRLALLGAPSAAERARRATVLPVVGRAREIERLARALVEGMHATAAGRAPLVGVRGPRGSGRTRVVEEAMRAVQAELARDPSMSQAVPSLVRFREGMEVPAGPVVVLAEEGQAAALALHRAAALSGARVAVVVESDAEVPGASVDLALPPLGAVPFAELVHALVGATDRAVVEAYRREAVGQPGVLVRRVAELWRRGVDPRDGPPSAPDAGTSSDLGPALPLARAAALVGGAIDAASARRIAGAELARAEALLVDRGLAEHDADGRLALTPALADTLAGEIPSSERRGLAARLVDVLPRGAARALARAALGPPSEARADVLAAATALRDEGAPEQAAGLLARARRFGDDEALALAEGDAWLAAGRIDEALRALEGASAGRALWLRAEALRRAGRWDEARAALEGAASSEPALVRASQARIALATGGALPSLDDVAPPRDPTGAALVDETRALLAHTRGDARGAIEITTRARRGIEEARGLAAFERARALARLDAVEASARAASGDAEGAHAAFERSASLAAAAGERHATAAFLVNLGIGRLELGALGPAIEALERGAERLVLLGRDRDAARALYNVANAALLAGDRAHARHAAEGALREARRVADEEAASLAEVVLADVDVGEGRPRAAERRLEALLARSPSVLAAARLASARALALDVAGAEAALARVESESESESAPAPQRIEVALAQTRIALARGEVSAARTAVERARALLGARGPFELRLRWLAADVDVAEAEGDAGRTEAALRAQRSALDAALASLPIERQAQFRALHARALAAGPLPEIERARAPERLPVAAHARALVEELRASTIATRLVASARALASAEHAALVVREPSGALVTRAAYGPAGPLDPTLARVSTSIVARCLDRRALVSSIDAGADVALEGGASIHTLAVRSVIALPIAMPERDAVLYVDDRLRPSAFGPEVEAALEELAGFAAVALAHAARARRERRAQGLAARRERALRASLEEKTRDLALVAAEHPEQVAVVAESAPMRRVLMLAARVAASEVPVLLTGESGTGKEVLARFVHRASARAGAPFVAESCGAIPLPLLESTLFGHVRGAFSGASARRRGLFELAEGGTLFLDEVGEMPLEMQAKLLRVLSAREIRPVGSERARPIDVRVIAATHRDLRAEVARGTFREDLFYRLAVVEIPLPPLRERREDVEPLVREMVRSERGEGVEIEPAALEALLAYPWPGNVRELENEVRRALALDGHALRLESLSTHLRGERGKGEAELDLDLKRATDRLERELVTRALGRAGHNVTQAARLLGLSRFGLQKMMARHAARGRAPRQSK